MPKYLIPKFIFKAVKNERLNSLSFWLKIKKRFNLYWYKAFIFLSFNLKNLLNLIRLKMSFAIILSLLIAYPTLAQSYSAKSYYKFDKNDYYLLYDPDLDEILLANNHHKRITPSSMTKLMTAYVVFNQLANNFIELDDLCLVGKDAWKKYGSTMLLDYGDIVKISDLIKGLLVMSGNDAATALAQITITGGYDKFINMMNLKAMELDMINSNFQNPHGLHQDNHYSTLMDLAILIKRLYEDFPQYGKFLRIKEFDYLGFKKENHNPLIRNNYDGILGGKTGYTSKGGYGITTIVKRNHRKLIAVVNNVPTINKRNEMISELLDFGFNNFKKIRFFNKDETIAYLETWPNVKEKVEVISKKNIDLNIPQNIPLEDIEVKVEYLKPLPAPIISDEKIADLNIIIKNYDSFYYPLYAKKEIKDATFIDKVKLLLKQKDIIFKNLFN